MKNAAVISATLMILILMTGEVEAADFEIDSGKNFVEQKRFVPPIKIPRREKAPRKFYTRRVPVRPTPHYVPRKSKPSRDNRGGGGRRNFKPPQAPFK